MFDTPPKLLSCKQLVPLNKSPSLVDNHPITEVSTFQYLGVTLTCNLSLSSHIQNTVNLDLSTAGFTLL